ncbi:MAG: acyl-CoA dehydrogenase family protein [Thalassobaculaceae bacterium]|uniref:acyl-CoA dehydrogenase family protein n=1 Tax=Roseitalea porphyridii TaxID=1852022 RepID=UPI0032EED4BE
MTAAGRQEWLDGVGEFARSRVAPAAAAWSLGASPGPEENAEAGRLGLFGIELPSEHGGGSYGFAGKAAACEILAAADFGFAMSVVNTHNVALRLSLSAADRIRERYLPDLLAGRKSACTALTEPGAGSDLAALATTAERSGDGWILNGEKSWIINGRHPGLCIVFAQTDRAAGLAGLGAFLVDLDGDGVRRHAIESGFSQTSIGTGGFVLTDTAVADDAMILPPGKAFRAIIEEINGARVYVAAMCCGMLKAGIATAAAYGARREVFGRKLEDHQAWRAVLAEAETDLAAARALTAEATGLVDRGEDARLAAAQAKIAAVETGQRHLPALLHAMGAEGLRPEHCLARHLGALQTAALADGANALLKQQVAKLSRQTTTTTEA